MCPLAYWCIWFCILWVGTTSKETTFEPVTSHTILRRQDSLSAVGYVGFCNIVPIHHSAAETNGQHCTGDILDAFLLTENVYVLIQISLTFLPMGHIEKSSLVQAVGLEPNRRQAIIPELSITVHWRIYAPTGHNELYILQCPWLTSSCSSYNINTLAPGRCGRKYDLRPHVTDQVHGLILWSESVLSWMPHNTFHDKSTLVVVMAWWHQAQVLCWPKSMSPYVVICRH